MMLASIAERERFRPKVKNIRRDIRKDELGESFLSVLSQVMLEDDELYDTKQYQLEQLAPDSDVTQVTPK